MTFDIEPKGPFSLSEAATFGFGQRHDTAFDGTMRLAFCVDGYRSQAAVAVTQPRDTGTVHGVITGARGDPDPTVVAAQVARVLSLDQDASGFVALGDTDPVIARLLEAAPGLRPPLFYSAYEAAFSSVLSARRNHRTAEAWRQRISEAAGPAFEVAGRQLWALPTPQTIAGMGPEGLFGAAGVEPVRAERLCGVALAAAEGRLEMAELRGMPVGEARTQLRTIAGIGPFYADLILIRGTGATDILPVNEPRFLGILGELYGLGGPATQEQAERMGRAWAPWVAVLVRAAGPRVRGEHLG